MRIAFITDPLDSFRIYKDSTFAMMEEAARRGHVLFQLAQSDLALERGRVVARAQRIELTGVAHDSEPHGPRADWYRHCEWIDGPLAEFDAVLMRKDPPFDMEYVYSTYLLELAQEQGAQVFNNPRAIRDCNEKLTIARYPQFTAPTLVARDAALIHDFLAEHGDIILKPLDGMGGASVFRVGASDPNLNVIIETITQHGSRTVVAADGAQQVLPLEAECGKRGGQVLQVLKLEGLLERKCP